MTRMYGRRMRKTAAPARSRRRPIQLAPLRGFAAAARHLSFTQAAAELKLTQSSISRQVAALEADLGQPLFVRETRALRLTAAGERLHRAVQQALAGIDRAVDELRGGAAARRVTVTTYASFASLWLVPRLAQFQHLHPGIEIRIDAVDRMVDLEAEGIDLALRWIKPGSPLPAHATLLGAEEFNVALSPRLLAALDAPLKSPADLDRLPVLAMDDSVPSAPFMSWEHWCKLAGVAPIEGAARMIFTYTDQCVQAAVRGQGVALVRTPFLDDLVAAGELVTPFPALRRATGFRYFLVENPQRRELPQVAAFRQFVIDAFSAGPLRAS